MGEAGTNVIQVFSEFREQFEPTARVLAEHSARMRAAFEPIGRQLADQQRLFEPLALQLAEQQRQLEDRFGNLMKPCAEASAALDRVFRKVSIKAALTPPLLPRPAATEKRQAFTNDFLRNSFACNKPGIIHPPHSEKSTTVCFEHDYDYRRVRLGGLAFDLGPKQGLVVRMLHEASNKADPWVHGKLLLRGSIRSLRVSELFKSQLNWRALIESNGRGMYRLNLPR